MLIYINDRIAKILFGIHINNTIKYDNISTKSKNINTNYKSKNLNTNYKRSFDH